MKVCANIAIALSYKALQNRLCLCGQVVVLLSSLLFYCASNAYASSLSSDLSHLAKVLQLKCDTLADGTHYVKCDGRTIVMDVAKGSATHIGYALFPEEMKQMARSNILTFLERYFLLIDHPLADRPSNRRMQEDRFKFLTGSSAVVGSLLPSDAFSFDSDSRVYTATWTREGSVILSVSFPAEHQLITGMTKGEADKQFKEVMLSIPDSYTPPQVSESTLKPTRQPGFYILSGGTYLNGILGSDCFYEKRDDSFHAVNDVSHPLESVSNILLGAIAVVADYSMKVTQVFGYNKMTFEMPLSRWLSLCQHEGCKLYCGVESADEKMVKMVVLAVNFSENYNHLLSVTVPVTTIEAGKGSMDARLETYIPMHNVLNLFGRYHKVEHVRPKIYVE